MPTVDGIGGRCGVNHRVAVISDRAVATIISAGPVDDYCGRTTMPPPPQWTMMMTNASRCDRGTTTRPHDASCP